VKTFFFIPVLLELTLLYPVTIRRSKETGNIGTNAEVEALGSEDKEMEDLCILFIQYSVQIK
jgi:hypothetical protein